MKISMQTYFIWEKKTSKCTKCKLIKKDVLKMVEITFSLKRNNLTATSKTSPFFF